MSSIAENNMKTGKPVKLGRGLNEIFASREGSALRGMKDALEIQQKQLENNFAVKLNLKLVPVNAIQLDQDNPRLSFDEKALEELACSIKLHGVIQPILLSKSLENHKTQQEPEYQYQMVAGFRRLKAAQIAGLKEIAAFVVKFNANKIAEISLIENLQRVDLSAYEEALAYESLINRFDYSQEQVAKGVGKARSSVANSLRLLKLPQDVLDLLAKQTISAGHARALLSVENPSKLAEAVVEKNLSVRQTEKIAQQMKNKPKIISIESKMLNYQGSLDEKANYLAKNFASQMKTVYDCHTKIKINKQKSKLELCLQIENSQQIKKTRPTTKPEPHRSRERNRNRNRNRESKSKSKSKK